MFQIWGVSWQSHLKDKTYLPGSKSVGTWIMSLTRPLLKNKNKTIETSLTFPLQRDRTKHDGQTKPKVLCKPHSGNSHLEMGV